MPSSGRSGVPAPVALAGVALPPPPWIAGHRGAAGEAPENTLESLCLAREQGADLLEVDLQLAADGVLVAVHDRDLSRLAGRPELVVEEIPSTALLGLEIQGPGESRAPLVSLATILARLPESTPLNLELKRWQAPPAKVVQALLAATAGRSNILVSSFDLALLARLRRCAPGLPLAPICQDSAPDLLAAGERLQAATLHCGRELATASFLRSARRPVLVFTVNDPQEAIRLFRRGAAGVFSDHPARLRRALPAETARGLSEAG